VKAAALMMAMLGGVDEVGGVRGDIRGGLEMVLEEGSEVG